MVDERWGGGRGSFVSFGIAFCDVLCLCRLVRGAFWECDVLSVWRFRRVTFCACDVLCV